MLEKRRKQARYEKMLLDVPACTHRATLLERPIENVFVGDSERQEIISNANEMLRDENAYFTFRYLTRGLARPWNYDPSVHMWWPQRHYTEQELHAEDTPQDAKMVWEINRFKDLPTLAQAAYLTHDKRYADEVESRLLSWIDDNPFASSVNWASGLELGIRLLSWSATLQLLRASGSDLSRNDGIARSIFEHAAYLRAELSTDKIVRSNHLIGESAGLFVTSTLWAYPGCEEHAATARALLESEILRQTFDDGGTRESSTWYHGFVTDLFEIAARVGERSGIPFSTQYHQRLAAMKVFRESMKQPDGTLVRIGDADDGHALFFEGEPAAWLDSIFGPAANSSFRVPFFGRSGYACLHDQGSALFVRGGEFGMGGNGSSSHAHDDLLAPVLWLQGLPVLVDPGTYVYNGAAKFRSRYRGEHSHNTFSLDEGSEAKQKLNFGWYQTRKPARLRVEGSQVIGSYAEWPAHERVIELASSEASITDTLTGEHRRGFARLHLHPMWKPVLGSRSVFINEKNDLLRVEIEGWKRTDLETYDYSPSYRVQVPAIKVILQTGPVRGKFAARLRVERRSERST